jgi:6-pyruvoyl-tetrahydropterin synthase
MLEQIYKSPNLIIEYDPENKMIITTWIVKDLNFTTEDFKRELMHYLDAVQGREVHSFLIDTREYNFPLTPEISQWIIENITPKLEQAGVKKFAYVLPKEFVSRIGVELLIDEAQKESKIIRRFFEDYDQAKQWLIK